MFSYNKKLIYLSSLLLISLTTLKLSPGIKTISNEDEFLCLIDQSKPAVVMGSMENCPHCKIIAPVFENHSKKNKKISFFKANGPSINMHGAVKRESKGKGDFKIIGYPAFVFIRDKRIDSVIVGATPEILEKAINDFNKKICTKKE